MGATTLTVDDTVTYSSSQYIMNDSWWHTPNVPSWIVNVQCDKSNLGKLDITSQKEVKEMRGLFEVYIVDYRKDRVLASDTVIADNAEKAKMKMLTQWDTVIDYNLDDLDIICVRLGDVRKKAEVQKVKVVED